MTRNMGDADRTARVLVGAALGYLFVTQHLTGAVGIALGVISVYLLATSVSGWCALYAVFRFSTRSPHDASTAEH